MVRTKIGLRGVRVKPLEFVAVGKADGVDNKVELAPFLLQPVEGRVDAGAVLHIARQHQPRVDLLRQRLDAAAEGIALVGEGEFRTLGMQLLGDPPRQSNDRSRPP